MTQARRVSGTTFFKKWRVAEWVQHTNEHLGLAPRTAAVVHVAAYLGGREVPVPTALDPHRPMNAAERVWASRWRRSCHGRLCLPHTREHVGEAEMVAKAFRQRRPRPEAFA